MSAAPLLRRERDRHWTRNLLPGASVYGERLQRFQGAEYRLWSAQRSKVAAYLEKGGRRFAPRGDELVLYLGAASGTTVSHVSDLVPRGRVVAVELSPRPFRDLLHLSALRPNILPVLGDARFPEAYDALLDRPADLLVQDIAQRDLVEIFRRNVERLAARGSPAFLTVKSRSVDVAASPPKIYDRVRDQLSRAGLRVVEEGSLEPFEKDHALFVVEA